MRQFYLFIFLLTSSLLQAQKHGLSIEAGQSFGILSKDFTDAAFPSQTSYTLGNGQSQSLSYFIFPDSSNWYFTSGVEWFRGAQAITAFKQGDDSFSYSSNARTLNSLRLQAQLAYRFDLKYLKLDIRAGVILPVISKNREEQLVKDSNVFASTTVDLKNYTSLGFKGGLTISKSLTKDIEFFINSDVVLLNTQVKSSKVVSYYDSDNRTLETEYPDIAYREIQYRKDPTLVRNNESVLPALFRKNQATDKLTYTQSVCSINLKLGFLFLF